MVERVLGRGGMGSVFAVVDESTGARLALKRLRADVGGRAAALFEREYRILAGLRHPCIVEVYDYGVDADGAYYTMELVEGHDLGARAPVAWRTACAYLRDAASILGLLHARRLLHRDLSPRNLIGSDAGRLKLIDFGALADFGPTVDVAGTPPYVPPEALRGGQLDQRSDLFALGALGHFLITGSNAFPARELSDLPELWLHEPAPASAIVRGVGNDLLEAPPRELDELLSQLLRIDPRERIASTAELIDRLNVIAGLPPEASDDAIQGYLRSKAFVGRESELARANAALMQARAGSGQALLIEGDAGVGRSRFIAELTVTARLAGALALSVHSALGQRPFALAASLLAQWHRALPREAQQLTEPFAQVLAPISPLRSRAAEPVFGERRARLQHALLEIFSGLLRSRFVALIVDDLQDADEESRALLNALAHAPERSFGCLIAGVNQDVTKAPSAALSSLRGVASSIRLQPLTAPETRNLLRSVFGEVAYLDRLAERLHRSAEGNPAHCLELAQYLVRSGAARYEEGGWLLPMELSPESLPGSRRAGLLSRLDRLPAEARNLARIMSVAHGPSWTVAHAAIAAASSPAFVEPQISLLARERVLRVREDGYTLYHAAVREKLLAELSVEQQRAIHARLGDALAAQAAPRHIDIDIAMTLCACAHLLRARDLERAHTVLKRALSRCLAGDPARIGLHAAAFEEVLALLSDAGQDEYALCGPLGMLSVAGYFADRVYALRHGERAMQALRRVLELRLVEQLTPSLGPKAAFFTALAAAAVGCTRRRSHCLPVHENVRIMLFAASTLAGTAAICMDPDRAARYAACLAPFTALGRDHAASFVYQFTSLMEEQGRDRPARCVSALRTMIERLEDPRPIAELNAEVRASYHAGMHLPLGVFLVRRDDHDGLRIADKLERFSPLYAMSADHLRANYYAAQGDVENARTARGKLEVHAVQLGSAWQVETWAPVDLINIALRMNDAAEMKRAAQELARLREEVPSLALQELYARVSYLVLRGKHQEAIALYASADDPPFMMNGWVRTQGTLASAYNALGQHERARAICRAALAGADPADRQYVVMNLGAEIELAVAEAGLGRHALAHEQLRQLLALHEPNRSAVTLGSLHEARARVSLLERDLDAVRTHVGRALELYRPLGATSLVARARALWQQIEVANDTSATGVPASLRPPSSELLTRVKVLLRRHASGAHRARGCLQVALELCGAREGILVFPQGDDQPAEVIGEVTAQGELIAWAARSMPVARFDEETLVAVKTPDLLESSYKRVGETHYRAVPLCAERDGMPCTVAVLVLGSQSVPSVPEPKVLRAIAEHLMLPVDSVRG